MAKTKVLISSAITMHMQKAGSFESNIQIQISLGRPEIFEKVAKIGVGVHIWLLKVSKLTLN